ncbi:MAG TPA: hypothetical protein ENN60_00325 [archaeon]|nr:hypothetical protein [archaeon]
MGKGQSGVLRFRQVSLLALLMLIPVAAATLTVPAVDSNMKGVLVELTCELVPGQGRVLVTTEPYIGVSTQESERTALAVVKASEGSEDFEGKDVLFIFSAEGTASIDGGSAGAAMAVCLLAELRNQSLSPGVSMTGGVDMLGRVVQVGGVLPKAGAVADFARVFLIPAGQQRSLTYTKTFTTPREGIYIEEVTPLEINIPEYAAATWNLTVVEVASVDEAYLWFTGAWVDAREVLQFELPEFTRELTGVEALAEKALKRAESLVGSANDTLSSSYLEQAKNIPAGYPYTQANLAFLAAVTSQTSWDDVEPVARELLKQMKSLEPGDPYWRAEAELRLSWALFKEQNLMAQKDWLIIAANMLTLETFTNESVDMAKVARLANQQIVEAKQVVEESRMVAGQEPSADAALDLALESLEDELYFAALYNALDAMAWAEASKGASQDYLKSMFEQEKQTDFAEAYRRHAIYLLNQAGGDREVIKGALFSAYRADLRDEIFEELDRLPWSPEWGALDWKWLAILGLGVYVARDLVTKNRKGATARKTSATAEQDMVLLAEAKGKAVAFLQEKLRNGEITREAYIRLVRKLEGL